MDDERSIAEKRAVELAKKTGELRARWTDHGYVFPSETRTKLSEQNVNKIKQRVLRKAGLCHPCTTCGATGAINKVRCAACKGRGVIVWPIRIHDLRHPFVTDLIADGANPKAVQALAGHGDPSVTMKIYAKSHESRQREALERTAQARLERRKQAAKERVSTCSPCVSQCSSLDSGRLRAIAFNIALQVTSPIAGAGTDQW